MFRRVLIHTSMLQNIVEPFYPNSCDLGNSRPPRAHGFDSPGACRGHKPGAHSPAPVNSVSLTLAAQPKQASCFAGK